MLLVNRDCTAFLANKCTIKQINFANYEIIMKNNITKWNLLQHSFGLQICVRLESLKCIVKHSFVYRDCVGSR